MKERKIRIANADEAREFVSRAAACEFDIDVFYNRMIIDAKSILGVLSLDLRQVLTVQFSGENAEFEQFLKEHEAARIHNVA